MMQLQTAQRKRAKIKMAIQSPSGGGKSFSSLLIAKGLTNGDFSKVAVIDSENGSSNLYAHLGEYNVLPISPPYTPEKYIEAITVCENAGMEAIILDSISHAWDELLDFHAKLAGNSFTNWSKVTPRHKAFIDKILQCNAHVIATMRTKQDFVIQQQDNKYKVEKVGLKAIARENTDYEFTLVFDIDINHFASSSKDRTGLFSNVPDFKISSETGKTILEWCNSGSETNLDEVREKIQKCDSIDGLKSLYSLYIEWKEDLKADFIIRKNAIEFNDQLLNTQNYSLNGSE